MGVNKRIVLSEGLHNHPAVAAWSAATSNPVVPQCIHVYRENPRKAIYRLEGVAPGEAAVFAKRAVAARTVIERTVYQEILPHLPLTAPRYYGSWLDEPHGWLFVEDVGLDRYSREAAEHLVVAARWVGTLHTMAAQLPAARKLPDAGPTRYLTHLRRARDRIMRSLETFSYPPDELGRLAAALSQCAALQARWERVEAACARVPETLVHGDFQSKNVYLRTDSGSVSLLPIDWETVGWGTPATDLADLYRTRVDLWTYWTIVREAWPWMDYDAVERLAALGRLLSGCADIDWKCATLLSESTRGRSYAVLDLTAIAGLLTAAAHATAVLE
jgi:aminoglycoside phosphotransferase (APT) family kinase protein